jgi:hypothetical protein
MAKVKMTCPISKGACTECPIYRGRHFFMCFSKEYHGISLGAEQIDALKSEFTKGNNNDAQDKKFGMPHDIQKSSRWISNVEELIEVEELTERREP